MKFDALRKHLTTRNVNEVTLTFPKIEAIIGSNLPKSAYNHPAYWGNSRANARAHAWLDNGWIVSRKQMGKSITFTRGQYQKRSHEELSYTLSEKATITKIVEHLEKTKYVIEKRNDGEKHERGPDIIACNGEVSLLVEVKGYPSEVYAYTTSKHKSGERKPTRPSTQARHWFSQALLQVLLARAKNDRVVALGFPDNKVYRDYLRRLSELRRLQGIHVFFVESSGKITHFLPDDPL